MNGPEHYRRAEALLHTSQVANLTDIDEYGRTVEFYPERDDLPHNDVMHEHDPGNHLAAAQVHATLALADPSGFGDLLIRLDNLERDLIAGVIAPGDDDPPGQWMAWRLHLAISGETA